MMADELEINQETILQIPHDDLRRREHLRQVRTTETRIMPRLHPDLSR
jgi:hypothetical protein